MNPATGAPRESGDGAVAGNRFIRYLIVGGVNTAFGYSVFAILTYAGLRYPFAVLLATIAGCIFNFRSYGAFVFKSAGWGRLGRFAAIYVVLYGLNMAMLYFLLPIVGNVYLANGMVALVLPAFGFVLHRRFVYEKN